MKTRLILILCALVSLNGIAQSNNVVKDDHLNPMEGYFDMYKHSIDYYANIRSILYKGLKERPEVRYLVIPSFEVEYLFQIEKDNRSNNFEIVLCRAKQSLWYTEDKSKIAVETWRNSLSEDDAEIIISLFRRAVAGTKQPEVSFDKKEGDLQVGYVNLDGEKFFFTCKESTPLGLRTGVTLSPSKGSKMERLVDIASKVTELAKSDKGTVVLPDELKTAIVNLTNDLKNSAN